MFCTVVSFALEADSSTVRGTIGPVMHNHKASTVHPQQVSLVIGASHARCLLLPAATSTMTSMPSLTAMTSHVTCIVGQVLLGLQAFKAAFAQGKWSLVYLLALKEQHFRSGPPQQ